MLNKKSRLYARTGLDIVGLSELKELVPSEDAPSFIDVVHEIVMPDAASNHDKYKFDPVPAQVRSPLIALATTLCGNRAIVIEFAKNWINDRQFAIRQLKHPDRYPENCDEATAINELFEILIANNIIKKCGNDDVTCLDALRSLVISTRRPILNTLMLAWEFTIEEVPFIEDEAEEPSERHVSQQFFEALNARLEPYEFEIVLLPFGDSEWLGIRNL